MNPNLHVFVSFFFIVINCTIQSNITRVVENCTNIKKSLLNITDREMFRANLLNDLHALNCSNPEILNNTVSDFEKHENATLFCNDVKSIESWNTHNQSSFQYLVNKVFKDYDLCVLVCFADMNKNLWSHCGLIKNLTERKTNVEKKGLKIPGSNLPGNDTALMSILRNLKNNSASKPGNTPATAVNKSGNGENASEPRQKLSPSTAFPSPTDSEDEHDDSHYFIYFVAISIICILFYVTVYNKKKILALMIEGRKQKDKRRHASARYRKLNTNLEEVMPLGTSQPSSDSLIY